VGGIATIGKTKKIIASEKLTFHYIPYKIYSGINWRDVMPRKPRNLQPEMVYHVVCKGNNREFLLRQNTDKSLFLDAVRRYRARYDFEIYGFCVLDNHVHMLIKMGQTPLSKVMQGITQSFTQRFNQKYDRSGHVFEGRYFASPCVTLGSIMKTLAYIHLNPVKAGISKTLEYLWSSHYAYGRRKVRAWFDSQALMRRLSGETKLAKQLYQMHLEGFENDPLYLETHELDIIQEPMTLEELAKKIEVNRRYATLDLIVREARKFCANTNGGGAFPDYTAASKNDHMEQIMRLTKSQSCGPTSKKMGADGLGTAFIKAIVVLNRKLNLISNAELGRRLNLKKTVVKKVLLESRRNSWNLYPPRSVEVQNHEYAAPEMRQLNTPSHLKKIEDLLLETLLSFQTDES
jgi:REP element-mobilizing transposase RayT